MDLKIILIVPYYWVRGPPKLYRFAVKELNLSSFTEAQYMVPMLKISYCICSGSHTGLDHISIIKAAKW